MELYVYEYQGLAVIAPDLDEAYRLVEGLEGTPYDKDPYARFLDGRHTKRLATVAEVIYFFQEMAEHITQSSGIPYAVFYFKGKKPC